MFTYTFENGYHMYYLVNPTQYAQSRTSTYVIKSQNTPLSLYYINPTNVPAGATRIKVNLIDDNDQQHTLQSDLALANGQFNLVAPNQLTFAVDTHVKSATVSFNVNDVEINVDNYDIRISSVNRTPTVRDNSFYCDII